MLHAGPRGKGPPAGHAARGHELNDQYMKNFETAYAMLASDTGGVPLLLEGGGGGGGGRGGGWAVGGIGGGSRQGRPAASQPRRHEEVGGDDWGELEGLETLAELCISGRGVGDVGRWSQGPSDPRGTMIDLSDRPNMCMSVLDNEAVIGSSDHALYGIDIRKAAKSRTLYTKSCGEIKYHAPIDARC